jgi:hypothetical protein
LLEVQAGFGGGFNRHGAYLILAEIMSEHGEAAADRLIRDLGLDTALGIGPGARAPSGDA